VMRAMADDVTGKPSQVRTNILMSAARFQQDILTSYDALGKPLTPEVSDMFRLSDSLASILSPLYEEIHFTFANPEAAFGDASSGRAAATQLPHSP